MDIHLSDYDLEWAKNPTITDPVVARKLIALTIAQAVEDYRHLRSLGVIQDGKVNPSSHKEGTLRRRAVGYRHSFEIGELVEFFQSPGLKLASSVLGIDQDAIASRL